MRILFTKGRLEPTAQKRIIENVPSFSRTHPPKYFYSSIFDDLVPRCRAMGWDIETLLVGSDKDQRLNVPNVVVNLISEPLLCDRALGRLDQFIQEHKWPVLNSVEATRRSSRTALPGILSGEDAVEIPNVLIPLTTRYSGPLCDLETHINGAGHCWPVLVRPPGIHGGRGMRKLDGAEAIDRSVEHTVDLLVTDFIDYRSTDGLYKKYRMIWVDGKLYRRHLISAESWNVGGGDRVDMVGRSDLIEAEKCYLASSADELDTRVEKLFRTVGLDFALIDFSVSDAGKITVFELNGSFQLGGSIPEEAQETWGYLEANNAPILEAILAAIARRQRLQ